MTSLQISPNKRFQLYSIAVELKGQGCERLIRDFDFFTDRPQEELASPERFSVILELVNREPKAEDLPPQAAERIFPDCVLYRHSGRLIYEYGEAVLSVTREGNSSFGQLICANDALSQELGYLYLQSEIGRFLDRQGLHRVHALGIGLPHGKGALVLLPSGGGKSALAAEVLKDSRCQLLSDDTPLMDRFGNLYPYPMRLSFRSDAELPEAWREKSSVFERRRHGKKILVPTSSLPSGSLPRLEERFRPGFLILARRHGRREEPRIKALRRWKGAFPLFRDLVVGLGIPQVAELILTRGAFSLPGLAPTAASRLTAATAYLARAKIFRFDLSRDRETNASFLLEHLIRQSEL